MSDQFTNEPTVDPADIGPNDLWLVWYSTLPLLQDLGEEPVGTSWALSGRGPDGLQSLQKEAAFGQGLVAAFPLSVLQAMRDSLFPGNPTGLIGWAKNALNLGKLMFVQDPQGNARIVSSEADLRPRERKILSGNRNDLLRMVREGEEILATKNWRKVFSDHRPFVKHGEVGWLHYQHDPIGAEILKDILERHRSNE